MPISFRGSDAMKDTKCGLHAAAGNDSLTPRHVLIPFVLAAVLLTACATTSSSGGQSSGGQPTDAPVIAKYSIADKALMVDDEVRANFSRETATTPELIEEPFSAVSVDEECENLGRFVCEPATVAPDQTDDFVDECEGTMMIAASMHGATHYKITIEPECDAEASADGHQCRRGEGVFFRC